MSFVYPTVSSFKAYFVRDFPYGENIETSVLDADITKAIDRATVICNTNLFSSQDEFTLGFLLLTAHYLVSDLRNSSQGLSGKATWLESSKGVSSVSVSHSIPSIIADNPQYSYFMNTSYGVEYLMLIYTNLIGNVVTVDGGTNP